jgi:hypothetical protein
MKRPFYCFRRPEVLVELNRTLQSLREEYLGEAIGLTASL